LLLEHIVFALSACAARQRHLQGVVGCRLIQRVVEDSHERRAVQIGGENIALGNVDRPFLDRRLNLPGKLQKRKMRFSVIADFPDSCDVVITVITNP